MSESHSFKPIWKPKFISKLAPEDRCHLNGMAADDKSYVAGCWRDGRTNGGIVIDITTDEIIASGLSMPHSPRVMESNQF